MTHLHTWYLVILQTCDDVAFCKRLRGNKSSAFQVQSSSVVVEGSTVTARVIHKEVPEVSLALHLTAFGGMVRLFIDEPSASPRRYQVSDVLLPSIQTMEMEWQLVKKTATKLKLTLGVSTNVELQFDPIRLIVSENSEHLFTWNAAEHFIFEHRRQQQEDDPEGWWSESFKTHHDSKPRGPESISWDLELSYFQFAYGIPEHAGSHALKPTVDRDGSFISEPYRLYNLDVFEYLSNSPFGLYGSIPFIMAHRFNRTIGAFWLNAAEMYVDISYLHDGRKGLSTQWIAESGVLDVFFLLGPSPADVSAQYASLTGGTALPQMFALGYHQCRWNYKDEADVAEVDAGFDSHTIPYDVIWLDIEHTDGKRYFTWDESHFPTPIRMQDDIASRGRKMVTIVDPHIKRDDNWPLFSEARDNNLFVEDNKGKDFDGWCWPGSSSYLDYASAIVRSWWADRFSLDQYKGSTINLYTWNDMNEPSVFNGPEITMPKDVLHVNGTVEHRELHNAYGFFYHMATADGLKRRGFAEMGVDGDRPFVLSRAFFLGSQRVGAIWTGDNGAEWDHLEVSVPMLLTIGVSGLPFSGADVGGFFGNPDAELMIRWYQVGAYYPFFRGHAHLESNRREPWLFGEEATNMIRAAIRTRYRILPYLYTQFLHANATGAPIMRPLWYEFPEDNEIGDEDKIFMLGSALLVAPVLTPRQETVRVVLPGKDTVWYDGISGLVVESSMPSKRELVVSAPLDTIRTFIRGGQMLTLKERPRRSTTAMSEDPLTLVIALDTQHGASGDIYIDDGHSYAFKRGQYTYRSFSMRKDGDLKLKLRNVPGKLPPSSGLPGMDPNFESTATINKVVILGLPGGPQGWQVEFIDEDRVLESAPGPLYLQLGLPEEAALVIRNPGLKVDSDWEILFDRVSGGTIVQ